MDVLKCIEDALSTNECKNEIQGMALGENINTKIDYLLTLPNPHRREVPA
jgi:hypothetical protein